MNRRQVLRAGVGLASLAVVNKLTVTGIDAAPLKVGHTLPKLPYAFDALEPFIDARTMEIHHDKHHAAYVDNLNKSLAAYPELQKKDPVVLLHEINQVPADIRQTVINNGGGHVNHSLFWNMMAENAGGEPTGDLAKAIHATFGSFENFKMQFSDAAMKRFGSGWAWLVAGPGNKLEVISTANQDSPYMVGQSPILGIDVWEHAYYLKYQNRRADYVQAWWNVVNWKFASELYAQVKRS